MWRLVLQATAAHKPAGRCNVHVCVEVESSIELAIGLSYSALSVLCNSIHAAPRLRVLLDSSVTSPRERSPLQPLEPTEPAAPLTAAPDVDVLHQTCSTCAPFVDTSAFSDVAVAAITDLQQAQHLAGHLKAVACRDSRRRAGGGRLVARYVS